MSALAIIRDGSLNFPLFLHVLGAMGLVGGLLVGASALGFARGEVRLLRLGYWSLLAVALPGWVVMRVGAEWIYRKEHWDDVSRTAEPNWITIGGVTADAGGLIFLASLVGGGIGIYRLRQGKGSRLLKVTLALSLLLLAAYIVAVWAMTGKPT